MAGIVGILMRKWWLPFAAFALVPTYAAAQKPAGDTHETLGVALALGDKCQTYCGFEYLYISDLFQNAYGSSAVEQAKRRAIQQKSDATGRERNDAAREVEANFASQYRQMADRLGCKGGQQTMQTAVIEAYKEVGSTLVLVHSQQGGANVPAQLEPLTDLERGLIQAFHKTVSGMLGAQMPHFDQLIANLARAKAASMGHNPADVLKNYIDARDKAFTLIHHEALLSGAGWQVTGVQIKSRSAYAPGFRLDSEFGFHTMRLTKAGAPTLTLLAEPKKLETPVKVGAEMKRFGGILSVGIRDDGTIIAGLAGGNIDAAPQSLAINAVATGGMLAGSGKPATDDCPYARCFAFTLEQAKQFAKMGTIQFGLAADPTVTSGFGFVNAPVVTGLRLKPIVEGL